MVLDCNGMSVSAWIRASRVRLNMSPYHLAFKMGITSNLIVAWEEGKIEPDAHHMAVLEKILGPRKTDGV